MLTTSAELAEALVYREMVRVALAMLADAEARHAALEARYEALRDELRRYVVTKMEET